MGERVGVGSLRLTLSGMKCSVMTSAREVNNLEAWLSLRTNHAHLIITPVNVCTVRSHMTEESGKHIAVQNRSDFDGVINYHASGEHK